VWKSLRRRAASVMSAKAEAEEARGVALRKAAAACVCGGAPAARPGRRAHHVDHLLDLQAILSLL